MSYRNPDHDLEKPATAAAEALADLFRAAEARLASGSYTALHDLELASLIADLTPVRIRLVKLARDH